MDLNELFYNHQLALMGSHAPASADGNGHCTVAYYGNRIAEMLRGADATIRAPLAVEACCA